MQDINNRGNWVKDGVVVVRRLGKFSVLPSQFFCKPKMPQKHNLVINFFKSLELIFKSWMVEGRMVARRPVWRLLMQAGGGIGDLDLGAKWGGGRRWGKWIALECVLEMILLGLIEGLQMTGKATQDVGFKQLGEWMVLQFMQVGKVSIASQTHAEGWVGRWICKFGILGQGQDEDGDLVVIRIWKMSSLTGLDKHNSRVDKVEQTLTAEQLSTGRELRQQLPKEAEREPLGDGRNPEACGGRKPREDLFSRWRIYLSATLRGTRTYAGETPHQTVSSHSPSHFRLFNQGTKMQLVWELKPYPWVLIFSHPFWNSLSMSV